MFHPPENRSFRVHCKRVGGYKKSSFFREKPSFTLWEKKTGRLPVWVWGTQSLIFLVAQNGSAGWLGAGFYRLYRYGGEVLGLRIEQAVRGVHTLRYRIASFIITECTRVIIEVSEPRPPIDPCSGGDNFCARIIELRVISLSGSRCVVWPVHLLWGGVGLAVAGEVSCRQISSLYLL